MPSVTFYSVVRYYKDRDNYRCSTDVGDYYLLREDAQAEVDRRHEPVRAEQRRRIEADRAEVEQNQRRNNALVVAGIEKPWQYRPQPESYFLQDEYGIAEYELNVPDGWVKEAGGEHST